MYRGIKKNQHYTWLICAAQNMKNIAIKNDNVGRIPITLSSIFTMLAQLTLRLIFFNH